MTPVASPSCHKQCQKLAKTVGMRVTHTQNMQVSIFVIERTSKATTNKKIASRCHQNVGKEVRINWKRF